MARNPRSPRDVIAMTDDLWRLDATELARLIRLGRASSREATESCLSRLRAVNPAINAVVRALEEEALATADAADRAQARGDTLGPLHGVPATVKVNTDQAGCATDNGVVAFRDRVATEDAPVVANLKRAGAVIIGRTNTPAFSMRAFADNALHGRTLNPRDPALSAGGSSGGAGAAVATGIGPIAHGNDIAGSVRVPALFNGVVGLRVSLGRIPSYNPSQPVARRIGAQLMAVQGPLTRSVRDARLALAAMAQGDPLDTRWADVPLDGPPVPRPIRVALVAQNPGGSTHPAQARRCGRPAGTLPPRVTRSTTSCPPISTRSSRPGSASARPMCSACSPRWSRSTAMPMRGCRCACGWSWCRRPTCGACWRRWRSATSSCRGGSLLCSATRWW